MTIQESLLAVDIEVLRDLARHASGDARLEYEEIADDKEAELRARQTAPHPRLAIDAHSDEIEACS
jgi:DNA-binding protein YbaB